MNRTRMISLILGVIFPGLGLIYLRQFRGLIFLVVGIIGGGIVLLYSIAYVNYFGMQLVLQPNTIPFLSLTLLFIGFYAFTLLETTRLGSKLPSAASASLTLICPKCGGSGKEPRTQPPVAYAYAFYPNLHVPCERCYGKGKVPDDSAMDDKE